MKYLAMLGVVAALVVPNTLDAQDPLYGEENVLVVACAYVKDYLVGSDYGEMKWCRRYTPDSIVGNDAEIVVRVKPQWTSPIVVHLTMHKSLWGVGTAVIK